MVDFDGILSKGGLERLIKKAKIFEMKGCRVWFLGFVGVLGVFLSG